MPWVLYVGRFQPVHKGHLHAIREILRQEDRLTIAIGSSLSSHEPKNPFTLGERIEMLLDALDEDRIDARRYLLTGIPDTDFHPSWVTYVRKGVPSFRRVYTNDPLTSRLLKEEGYEVRQIPFYERELYSGTEIRRRILAGEDWSNLVPPSVYAFIKKIDGDARIKEINVNE